jgi:hypothetical protein
MGRVNRLSHQNTQTWWTGIAPPDDYHDGDFGWSYTKELRLATPQEIEDHLRKICDEKGFKTGVKIRGLDIDANPFNNCYVIEMPAIYDKDEDSFVTSTGDRIYCKGKFAEIVAQKKKLPKTKTDFNIFLDNYNSRHSRTTEEFLDDYEE